MLPFGNVRIPILPIWNTPNEPVRVIVSKPVVKVTQLTLLALRSPKTRIADLLHPSSERPR